MSSRCLCLSTLSTKLPSYLNWRLYSLWILEMTITSVLCGLKMVYHLLAQMLNLLRSSFKTLFNSAKLAEEKLKEVSSAKSLAFPIRSSAISFMNNKNKSGPKTDPCGTPAFNIASDKTPFTNTFFFI